MEEKSDVAGDITPEQFDGEEAQKAEPIKTDPSPEKEVEAKEEVKSESKPEEPKETDSVEPPAQVPVEETKPVTPTKAEERKTQLNTEIRDLVAQRNALKEQVTKANAEVYQPATEEELIEQGSSATDAKVEALRQQIEVRDYNEKVADAQLTLGSEAERVIREFPVFNPESPEYDKELATEAAELMESNLILDPNTNQIIGSNVSPYKLYKTLARATGISTVKGQLKGQQDTQQMLANADANSSVAPAKKPTDPLADLWKDPL